MTFQTDQIHFKTCDPFLRTVKIIENHSNNNWKILIERSIRVRHSIRWTGSYSSSHNLTPAISRALIGRYLIFCSPTWPTCCNSSRKCTPVKYKASQKAGFPIVTYTTSCNQLTKFAALKNYMSRCLICQSPRWQGISASCL